MPLPFIEFALLLLPLVGDSALTLSVDLVQLLVLLSMLAMAVDHLVHESDGELAGRHSGARF